MKYDYNIIIKMYISCMLSKTFSYYPLVTTFSWYHLPLMIVKTECAVINLVAQFLMFEMQCYIVSRNVFYIENLCYFS